jgi:hypothetical protein
MADLRATRVTAFSTIALLSTTQEIVRTVLPTLTDAANTDLVAEESLSMVATASARAVEVGLRAAPGLVEHVGPAILEAPFLYHDYLLGASLVAQGAEGVIEVDQSVYDRLDRKGEFYATHFPVGRFPGPATLRDKLPLWMGRISPPQLPTTPGSRLAESGVVEILSTHLRLLMAFGQRIAEGATAASG